MGRFNDVTMYKDRVDTENVDEILTLMQPHIVDPLAESKNITQTIFYIEINLTFSIQNLQYTPQCVWIR